MLHKRERFRRKCYSYITHCMSACKRFAAQFSSMLHLLNATSPHGLSQRFHFLKCCTRENAFDTSHTLHVCLQKVCSAILINATSPQCYISSRTQSAFSFFEVLHKRERFRHKCYSYITHCMSACKRFAAQFSSMLHLLNATSPHGLTGRMKVMLVEHHKM